LRAKARFTGGSASQRSAIAFSVRAPPILAGPPHAQHREVEIERAEAFAEEPRRTRNLGIEEAQQLLAVRVGARAQLRPRFVADPARRRIAVREGRVDGSDEKREPAQELRALRVERGRSQPAIGEEVREPQHDCGGLGHDASVREQEGRHLAEGIQLREPLAAGADVVPRDVFDLERRLRNRIRRLHDQAAPAFRCDQLVGSDELDVDLGGPLAQIRDRALRLTKERAHVGSRSFARRAFHAGLRLPLPTARSGLVRFLWCLSLRSHSPISRNTSAVCSPSRGARREMRHAPFCSAYGAPG
jgi:hypothetical protein